MSLKHLWDKKIMAGLLFLVILGSAPSWAAGSSGFAPSLPAQPSEDKELPPPGKKCQIDDNFYFTYEFSEKLKMGTVILKVQVFDKAGEKNSSFALIGRCDMPTMSGAHDSGDQEFKLNKKNDYLSEGGVRMISCTLSTHSSFILTFQPLFGRTVLGQIY